MWQGSYKFIVNQWGVGHGGFHSQSLFFQELDRNPTAAIGAGRCLRVIYDCGSGRTPRPRKALKDAVGRMLIGVADETVIDLLVISHFDQDHINGLQYLAQEFAKKKISVARVWAPLLDKIEVLFAIASSSLSGANRQAYAAFVDDPVGLLSGLFGGAEISQFGTNRDPIPLAAPPALDDDRGGEISLIVAPGGRGLLACPSAAPGAEVLWEFRPHVIESTLVGADAVSEHVLSTLGKPLESCTLDDLLDLAQDDLLLAKFHFAVEQHHKRESSNARQSSARTGPNLSSLCLYSGPASPYEWCHFRRGWDSLNATPDAIPIAPAWLGTGDAGLFGSLHVDAMRAVLTPSRFDRIGISSVPHHGSKFDSDLPLWEAMPNARWVTIEANNRNGGDRNHHPHQEVLSQLKKTNIAVHIAIDGDDFRWSDKRIR